MKHLLTMYKNDFAVVLDFRDINRYIAVLLNFLFLVKKKMIVNSTKWLHCNH